MNKTKKMRRQVLALLTALMMCISSMNTNVFAEEIPVVMGDGAGATEQNQNQDDFQGGEKAEQVVVYTLLCQEAEHLHGDSCFAPVNCMYSDDAAHVHDKSCYGDMPICGRTEHTHTLACYSEPETYDCDENLLAILTPTQVLACGLEGHFHNLLCTIPAAEKVEEDAKEDESIEEPEVTPEAGEAEEEEPTVTPEVGEAEEEEPEVTPEAGKAEEEEPEVTPEAGEAEEEEPTVTPEVTPETGEAEEEEPEVTPEAGEAEEEEPTEAPEESGEIGEDDSDLLELMSLEEEEIPVWQTSFTCGVSEEEHVHNSNCYTEIMVADLAALESWAAEEVPEAVQAFLDAVAALLSLEDINEENYEEILALAEICMEAYDALESEDWEREDVSEAIIKLQGLMEEAQTLALNFAPVAQIGDMGYPSLALAVNKAEAGATITLIGDVTENVAVDKSVTIDLNGRTWTGRNNDSTLTVTGSNGVTVTVKNGSMTAVENCKIIKAISGKLVLDDIVFTGVTTKEGAINLSATTLGTLQAEISKCTFTNNIRAIYASKAELTLNNCDISENSNVTWANGAIVYLSGTNTTIIGGRIADNIGVEARVIEVCSGGYFVMDGTELSNNTSYGVVGTSSNGANITLKNVTATGNIGTSSMNSGGSVLNANFIDGKTVILENVIATGNQNTKQHGGAFYFAGNVNTVINITNCTIAENIAKSQGGGIYLINKGTTTITDTIITGNIANWSVSGSTAFGNGGGGLCVANTSGTVTLNGSTRIYGNSTPNDKKIPNTNDGGSADIALASTTLSSSTNAKNPDSYTRATLVLEGETSFVDEKGNCYTLTQFDRFLINTSNGWYYASNKYSWPMGYYTVMEKPVQIYLGTEGQHTDEDGITATTMADAVAMAKEKNVDTIYVCGNFTVDMASVASLNDSGITFARCSEHPNGHMFTINGDVTLDGAHIDGMNVNGDASMIYVPASAHLTITGETVIENGKNTAERGKGGAISVSQGSMTMTGGTITNNSACEGGGIYAMGGKLLVFEGGTVSQNIATGGNGGGGAYIEATSSEFGVQGGRTLFDSNESNQLGGGVFIVNGTNANTHHYIYKATFTNNKSYRSMQYFDGGAIYIQSGTTVHMKNVYVTGNSDGDKADNGYTAVAVCPTGRLAVYELDGLLSVNNGKNPDIGVIAAGQMPKVDPKVYLASHTIGGGEVSYTYSNGTAVDISDYQFIEGYFRLYTKASDSVIDAAQETAEKDGVLITGNYASQYGSGIMTNGTLKIGTETQSLKVVKNWADSNENHEDDQILVYLTMDGQIVPQDFRSDASVILNKDNNWSYTWTNLGDQFEWGVAEASVGGYLSEVKVEKDTQFSAIADKYYIATITNTPEDSKDCKLAITKIAYGLNPDDSYAFTLKLDNVGNKVFALQLNGTLYPIYNNEITFFLKDGESAVVDGLPEGFTYEVTEAESDDYLTYSFKSVSEDIEGSITSIIVCNIAKIDIPVQKNWADTDDGPIRPESIRIALMNGTDEVASSTLSEATGWRHTFTDLPKYDAEGNEIVYTVKESGADAYDVTYGSMGATLTITNTLKRGELKITKALVDDATYPSGADKKEYSFVVTGPEGYRKEVTITGADSRTLSGLVPGAYTVTEVKDGIAIENYTWSVEEGEVTAIVRAEDTAEVTITNQYTRDTGNLAISKAVKDLEGAEANAEHTFTFTIEAVGEALKAEVNGKHYEGMDASFADGKATVSITVNGNGSSSITIQNLPTGTYTVTENGDEAAIKNHVLSVFANGEKTNIAEVLVKAGSTEEVSAEFTNTYMPYGSLTIHKSVVGGPESAKTDKEYTFTVVGRDANGRPVTGSYDMNEGKVSFDENGEATITITGAGSATLKNLPLGEYTVTEAGNAEIDNYTWTVSVSGDKTNEGKAIVTADDAAEVTITNTYVPYGSLTITKKVIGGPEDAAANKEYTFTVAGKDTDGRPVTGTYTMGGETVTFNENGEAIVAIRGANSVTIEKLPLGEYTVSEDTEQAKIDGYMLSVIGNGVKVEVAAAGDNAEASITNSYTETTSLTVNKVWSDGEDAHVDGFVTVNIMNGTEIVATVTLNAANHWTATVEGLEIGQSYTVEEIEVEGYTSSYTTNEDGSITITNTLNEPEPTPEVTPEPTPEVTPGPTPEVTPGPTPEVTPGPTPEVTPEPTPEVTPEVTPEPTPEVTPEVTPEPIPEVTPEVTPEPIPDIEIPEDENPLDIPEVTPMPIPEIEIPDDEIPLAIPEVTPEPEEIEIPEEENPLDDGTPKTGDSTKTWLWSWLCLLSAGIVMALLPGKKRQK